MMDDDHFSYFTKKKKKKKKKKKNHENTEVFRRSLIFSSKRIEDIFYIMDILHISASKDISITFLEAPIFQQTRFFQSL